MISSPAPAPPPPPAVRHEPPSLCKRKSLAVSQKQLTITKFREYESRAVGSFMKTWSVDDLLECNGLRTAFFMHFFFTFLQLYKIHFTDAELLATMNSSKVSTCHTVCQHIQKNNLDQSGRVDYINGLFHEYFSKPRLSILCYESSIKKGYTKPYYKLSQFYRDGTADCEKNPQRALQLCQIG